jgi:hypothetical protein
MQVPLHEWPHPENRERNLNQQVFGGVLETPSVRVLCVFVTLCIRMCDGF